MLVPTTAVTPVDDDSLSIDSLALLGRLAVPFGGLLRGRLSPGETAVIIGATGNFGSAAVLLACALGAERVIAAGRNTQALEGIARVAGSRVYPITLTGNLGSDGEQFGDHRTFHVSGYSFPEATGFDSLGTPRSESNAGSVLCSVRSTSSHGCCREGYGS